MHRKVIWVDERTCDYSPESGLDFKVTIENGDRYRLVECGESGLVNEGRAVSCIRRLKEVLDEIKNDPGNIIGFVLDVHIPVRNLKGLGDGLERFGTSSGQTTGYRIAEVVLSNLKDGASPYGDIFKDLPVLFFTVSKHENGDIKAWMERDFSVFDEGIKTQYTQLTKTFSKIDGTRIRNWLERHTLE